MDNTYGYAASMSGSASREHEGFVGRPPSTYPVYPTTPSLPTTSTQNAQGDRALAHAPPMPSDGHIDTLVDYYTRPPAAPHVGGVVASSSRLAYTSANAPEATWPMAPEPHPATAADKSLNMSDLDRGAFVVGANADDDASLSSTDSAANEVYYTHGFEGYLGASNSVAKLPQHAQMDPSYGNHARGQCDEGAYPRAPSRSYGSPPGQLPRNHSG
ncbi:hypothetical protein GSI_13155 [Ganoderma sinense ZZ0214-1]|uniref:Uncharacterized protein n=1 Tax=Ganoderma sinense ZZ0214-1 TaxID=1077348 RepID=A0A2G8RUS1_9APHY|nr:hypothetical protein GSI_13155 [Ganoderma sinense ZZ0214-1]